MGMHIINKNNTKFNWLVLKPMTEAPQEKLKEVRRWLRKNGP